MCEGFSCCWTRACCRSAAVLLVLCCCWSKSWGCDGNSCLFTDIAIMMWYCRKLIPSSVFKVIFNSAASVGKIPHIIYGETNVLAKGHHVCWGWTEWADVENNGEASEWGWSTSPSHFSTISRKGCIHPVHAFVSSSIMKNSASSTFIPSPAWAQPCTCLAQAAVGGRVLAVRAAFLRRSHPVNP